MVDAWSQFKDASDNDPWSKFSDAETKKPKRRVLDTVGGLAGEFNKNVPLADELAAAGGVVAGLFTPKGAKGWTNTKALKDAWDEQRKYQKDISSDTNKENPLSAAFARGTGSALSVALPAPKISAATKLGNVAQGALLASGQAGLSALTGEGNLDKRLKDTREAITDPVTLGLGALTGNRLNKEIIGGKPQTAEQLRKIRKDAYAAAEQTGVRFSQEAYDSFVNDLNEAARASNLSRSLTPKAAAIQRLINKANKVDPQFVGPTRGPSLEDIEGLRKTINRNITSTSDDAEQYFGDMFKKQLDTLVGNASPSDLVAGKADEGFNAIQNARKLNTRYRKVQAAEDALEAASLRNDVAGSGSNVDNTIRQELLKSYKKSYGLTPEEEAAYLKAIKGGKVQDVLRTVGKLSPTGNSMMMHLGVGATMLNPIAGVPILAGGVAKAGADILSRKNAQDLLRVLGSSTNKLSPQYKALRQALLARIARSAGAANEQRKENK